MTGQVTNEALGSWCNGCLRRNVTNSITKVGNEVCFLYRKDIHVLLLGWPIRQRGKGMMIRINFQRGNKRNKSHYFDQGYVWYALRESAPVRASNTTYLDIVSARSLTTLAQDQPPSNDSSRNVGRGKRRHISLISSDLHKCVPILRPLFKKTESLKSTTSCLRPSPPPLNL